MIATFQTKLRKINIKMCNIIKMVLCSNTSQKILYCEIRDICMTEQVSKSVSKVLVELNK